MEFRLFAKFLIALGVFLALVGLLGLILSYVPFFGRLPGDLHFQFKNVRVFFPLATCLILSLLITLLLNLFLR